MADIQKYLLEESRAFCISFEIPQKQAADTQKLNLENEELKIHREELWSGVGRVRKVEWGARDKELGMKNLKEETGTESCKRAEWEFRAEWGKTT